MEKTDWTYLHCQAVYKTCTLNEAVEHVILLVPETQEEILWSDLEKSIPRFSE